MAQAMVDFVSLGGQKKTTTMPVPSRPKPPPASPRILLSWKDAFDKWKKGLDNLAKDTTKKKAEKTLKIEIDDEAFDRLYGHISHPIEIGKKGQEIAARIISQFGEECTKVLLAD